MLYCTICNEEGIHAHKHIRITNVLSSLQSNLLKLNEDLRIVSNEAEPRYKKLSPIIKYLDNVVIQTEAASLARYPIKHHIYQDFATLQKLKSDLERDSTLIEDLV